MSKVVADMNLPMLGIFLKLLPQDISGQATAQLKSPKPLDWFPKSSA